MSNLSEIEDIFIETAAELARSIGINPIVGQIYAMLYIRKDPVSLDEISEKLKISKGNVCINIRVLENWQAVKKVWIKGSRKDYYTAETDFIKIILTRIQEGITRRLNFANESLEKIKSILNSNRSKADPSEKDVLNFYRERIKQLEGIRNLVIDLLKLIPSIDLLRQKNNLFKLLTIAKTLKKL